jgi:hypothetical protein
VCSLAEMAAQKQQVEADLANHQRMLADTVAKH